MRCERCRAEATSTGPGGQRLCDKHYNPTMAAAPGWSAPARLPMMARSSWPRALAPKCMAATSRSCGIRASGSGFGNGLHAELVGFHWRRMALPAA